MSSETRDPSLHAEGGDNVLANEERTEHQNHTVGPRWEHPGLGPVWGPHHSVRAQIPRLRPAEHML